MGKLRFNYRSEVLGYYVDITVVYPTDTFRCPETPALKNRSHQLVLREKPDEYAPGMKFQTVYLLHGGGDDDTLTYRYTNAEAFAQRNRVMLVTPNIANSFGANTRYGVPYLTFVTEELPTVIQALFASSSRREDNFIMGYAMGGNAALAAAITRPDRYSVCMDISGGIGMTLDAETLKRELESDHFQNGFPLYGMTFGAAETVVGSEFDLAQVARTNRENGLPDCRFVLACGSEEFIRARMENDARILKEMDFDVEYICAEGYDHDFRMWNDYIELGLDRLLPLKRAAIYPDEDDGAREN
ncbi:MAG: alpha/beta hydrolase-fold protein [Christensenella sp.]|nr:alpha/beta hydrolase-fold protein [Christensenella sp.]